MANTLRVARVGFLALAALTVSTALANDGRDFAGYYKIANTADRGKDVEITLTLQIYNNSGSDLNQSVVSVRESHPGSGVLASFPPVVAWRNGSDVLLTQTVTVPREEYERWTSHGQPTVVVTYSDESSREWQRTAQLNQRPNLPF